MTETDRPRPGLFGTDDGEGHGSWPVGADAERSEAGEALLPGSRRP
ncbi:hypothetical protein [Blastococcus deserti]|uniref:Uncharacterized protein n=1 Tax=Blastococcus deserti TaxID=2259033 RepID=A0ABW4XDW1_9ACTN